MSLLNFIGLIFLLLILIRIPRFINIYNIFYKHPKFFHASFFVSDYELKLKIKIDEIAENNFDKSNYAILFKYIFLECLHRMNEANKNLLIEYFSDERFYSDFKNTVRNIIFIEYINNLYPNEANKIRGAADFFHFNPCCKYTINTKKHLNICAGYIGFIYNKKGQISPYPIIDYNITSVAPAMPLVLITCLYSYFSQYTDLKDEMIDFLKTTNKQKV